MDELCFSLPEDVWTLHPADHLRTVIHLDVDCFYAQVEMVRNPSLWDKPLGVKQKNFMVTCNYVARSLGVKKSMLIKEALEALPSLVLVDGSDLTHYRQFSAEISAVAQSFTPHVERLGLDENFVDITEIVGDYVGKNDLSNIEGHVYGDKEPGKATIADPCSCGCQERMVAGALVAKKLRQQIFESTGITCCAGIAHNKLLAKLVSGYHKPNQQTVLFPWLVHHLMSSLHSAKSIPGIGSTTFNALEQLGISTVSDLQNASLSLLQSSFDEETSKKLKDLSFGIDETPVRRSGRPQSLGLEDAFRKVTCIAEVRMKYSILLERLLKLLKEDGRIPSCLRVCVRKYDATKKFGQRESRQTAIPPSLFALGVQDVGEHNRTSLLEQILALFHKMVDTSKQYHLTLVGVGFSKFIERPTEEKSISRFFFKRKRSEGEDQCISEEMSEDPKHVKLLPPKFSSGETCSSWYADVDSIEKPVNLPASSSGNSSITTKTSTSEASIVHSSKKVCHSEFITKPATKEAWDVNINTSNADVSNNLSDEGSSCGNSPEPCKLRDISQEQDTHTPANDSTISAPAGIDEEVFKALPPEIQDEILRAHQDQPPDPQLKPKSMFVSPKTTPKRKSCHPTLERYFKKSSPTISKESLSEARKAEESSQTADTMSLALDETSIINNNSSSSSNCSDGSVPLAVGREGQGCDGDANGALVPLVPPAGVDADVFNSLPVDIQREIVAEEKRSRSLSHSVKPKDPRTCSLRGRGASSSSSIMKYIKKV